MTPAKPTRADALQKAIANIGQSQRDIQEAAAKHYAPPPAPEAKPSTATK